MTKEENTSIHKGLHLRRDGTEVDGAGQDNPVRLAVFLQNPASIVILLALLRRPAVVVGLAGANLILVQDDFLGLNPAGSQLVQGLVNKVVGVTP